MSYVKRESGLWVRPHDDVEASVDDNSTGRMGLGEWMILAVIIALLFGLGYVAGNSVGSRARALPQDPDELYADHFLKEFESRPQSPEDREQKRQEQVVPEKSGDAKMVVKHPLLLAVGEATYVPALDFHVLIFRDEHGRQTGLRCFVEGNPDVSVKPQDYFAVKVEKTSRGLRAYVRGMQPYVSDGILSEKPKTPINEVVAPYSVKVEQCAASSV